LYYATQNWIKKHIQLVNNGKSNLTTINQQSITRTGAKWKNVGPFTKTVNTKLKIS